PSFASVVSSAPPELVAVIDRALAFEKEQRWPTAAAMREAFLLASRAVRTNERPVERATFRSRRRHRRLARRGACDGLGARFPLLRSKGRCSSRLFDSHSERRSPTPRVGDGFGRRAGIVRLANQ